MDSNSTTEPTDPVFISYRQSDGTKIAAELAWLLRAAGIPVWRDRDDLPPGDTESRLIQAIAAGISGGILVITPDVAASRVVRTVEAPRLLELHNTQEVFALGIANDVKNEDGSTDYAAPDRLLDARPGALQGVNQYAADRQGLLALIRGLLWHRIASQREQIQSTDQTLHLSVQTRNTPQVYDRTGDELDIRLRPPNHERLPSREGLLDLKDVIGYLPDAATRSGARRIRVQGGAHLSVAFAIGAAIPSSRIGHMEIVDQQGVSWVSSGESQFANPPHAHIAAEERNPSAIVSGRPRVAVYLDLLPQPSDTAFARLLEEDGTYFVAWRHLVSSSHALLDASEAGAIAADVAAHIREISNENQNAEVHLLLRCPFPMALLLGRLTNTLRIVTYEWDDSAPNDGVDYRARYVPTLRLRTSASGGVIEEVLVSEQP